MFRLFARVLEELVSGVLRVETLRGEVVTLVAQDAHEFGREGLVEDVDDPLQIRAVGVSYGTKLNVGAGSLAQALDVGEKLFHG